jgi:GT2 family glycosyltransferase
MIGELIMTDRALIGKIPGVEGGNSPMPAENFENRLGGRLTHRSQGRHEMNQPIASILISLTDHSDVIEIAEALAEQANGRSIEMIVADASGHPETRRVLRSIPETLAKRVGLRPIEIEPAGRGRALNEAVLRAGSELFLFLGDDFIPEPGWLNTHLEFHATHTADEAVAIGPGVFPEELRADPLMRWLDDTSLAFDANFTGTGPRPLSPTWFYGANTSIKRRFFWRAGLFDDDFPYDALEDYELSFRLFRLGMQVTYLPEAKAIHQHVVELPDRLVTQQHKGESLALLDAKYGARPLSATRLKWKSIRHRIRAAGWHLLSWFSSSASIREAEWYERMEAAFHAGYERTWRILSKASRPYRRLSPSLPQGAEEMIKSGVIRWKTGEKRSGQSLYPFDNTDSSLSETTQADASCLEVRNPEGAPWAYFRVDPIFAQYATQHVQISCELLAPPQSRIWIEYDSDDESVNVVDGKPGAFKRTQAQLTNGQWQTLAFDVRDLHPQQRINMGDFRIVCEADAGSPFWLRSVELKRDGSASPTPFGLLSDLQSIGFAPAAAPKVSIVIPVHNHLLYTLQCLQSLTANPAACEIEVIVVDDASTDQTATALRSVPGLRLVELDCNLGFTGACQRGADAARGEYLLFLNNDIVAQPRWLDELLAVAEQHRDAGIVGSRLIYPQTGTEQHIGIAFDDSGRPYHLQRDGGTALGPIEGTWPVPAVTGACLLTPRRLYEELGGFDPAYEQECQDIDYCCKVVRKGDRVYYCGSSLLLHYESVTRKELRWSPSADVERFLQRWEIRSGDSVPVERGSLQKTRPAA